MPKLTRRLSGSELRKEFVSSVIQEGVENIQERLEELHFPMCEDFLEDGLNLTQAKRKVLHELDQSFMKQGINSGLLKATVPEAPSEKDYKLWDSQKRIHELIMDNNTNFLITGPAGSGKTRLLSVIAEKMRVNKKNVAVTAISPLLASQFHDSITFSDFLTSEYVDLDVIFIDNGNLIPESSLKELDAKLRRDYDSEEVFGGKQVIIAADFQQCLPIAKGWPKFVDSIETSELLGNFSSLQLESSMKFILKSENFVELCDKLILETLGSMNHPQKFEERVLLAPKNADVDFLNKKILDMYPGDTENLYSLSKATSMNGDRLHNRNLYRTDCRGLEKHRIELKPNAIISLTRNQGDIPAGTRLIYLEKTGGFLLCQVLSGLKKGHRVQVHPYQHSATVSGSPFGPFKIERKQFPIQLAFAMTIHRAQGQYFRKVGLYNMDGIFCYGQERVAITRCRNTEKLRILVDNSKTLKTKLNSLT